MPVIASGALSNPFELASILLASSATFRALVGAADEDEALESIDFPFRDVDRDGYRLPGAIFCDDDTMRQFKGRLGDQAGSLILVLSAPVPEEYRADAAEEVLANYRDDILDWRNKLSAILQEMLSNARAPRVGGGAYFGMTKWHKAQIGWCDKSAKEFTQDEDPTADPTFRIGVFVLDWT